MSQKPGLYRTPQAPGYLGAYNWRASVFGLLLLLAVSFAATQYIAAQFQYQPALGRPLLRTKSGCVYQPFAWVMWGWRNSTSQDPGVRKPLFIGEMMVFAGSFLSVAIFFVTTNRRSRKLMEGAEDLHGSARWASEADIDRTGLIAARQGSTSVRGDATTGVASITSVTMVRNTFWLSRQLEAARVSALSFPLFWHGAKAQ